MEWTQPELQERLTGGEDAQAIKGRCAINGVMEDHANTAYEIKGCVTLIGPR